MLVRQRNWIKRPRHPLVAQSIIVIHYRNTNGCVKSRIAMQIVILRSKRDEAELIGGVNDWILRNEYNSD